jgi:hypothetical protein
MSKPTPECKAFLKAVRKQLNAEPEEKIDKRSSAGTEGYLAPNDIYYEGHCAYCAEADYLMDIYSETVERQVDDTIAMAAKEAADHNELQSLDDGSSIETVAQDPEDEVVSGTVKYEDENTFDSEAEMMNLKGLKKAQPKLAEDELAMDLAKHILDGKTPYGASVLVSKARDKSVAALYAKARRIYDIIATEESGGIDDIVAAVEAGDTVNVPELRAASVRKALRSKEIEFHTSSMVRISKVV